MLARVVRSGLVEAFHIGAWAVTDSEGQVIASGGEGDRPFYLRSAGKPFQATVSQEFGASLVPEHLAVAAASHDGDPVHVATVEGMLAGAGLDESSLKCPPAWPLGEDARRRMSWDGHLVGRRIWHNCSGKHAGMLRACVASDLPTGTYLDRDHPLQHAMLDCVAAATGIDPGPLGVDGCGAPVFRTNVVAMARGFGQLTRYSRFAPVVAAMHAYPALVSGTGTVDSAIAIWTGGVAKRGAEGCIGVALPGGIGIAVKAWDGAGRGVEVAVLSVLEQMGALPPPALEYLETSMRPPVLGQGRPVGTVEPTVGFPLS